MTGSVRACGSWVQTLTVSHSPVVSCGGSAAAAGARNRRSPSGGRAYGMPRKTAFPCSTRPRTRPDVVATSGSAGPMGGDLPLRQWSDERRGFYDFRSFNGIEHDHRDAPRRRPDLMLGERGLALALPAVDDVALGGLRQAGADADGSRANLDHRVRVGDQVVEPGRVLRRPRLRGEYGERVAHPLERERADPRHPGARPGMVQQEDVRPLERTADPAAVGPELSDDLAVEVFDLRRTELCHDS